MSRFEPLPDISFNTEKVADPSAFAREREAASWLCLTGEEFAAMEGGISFAQVQRAVGRSITSCPIRRGRSTSTSRESTSPPWTSFRARRWSPAAPARAPPPSRTCTRACAREPTRRRCSSRPNGTALRSASPTSTRPGCASRLRRCGASSAESPQAAIEGTERGRESSWPTRIRLRPVRFLSQIDLWLAPRAGGRERELHHGTARHERQPRHRAAR